MSVNRPVTIYISAASDLMAERESLARLIAGLPVTLAWRILQTPLEASVLDMEALQTADLHFLILGGDIRAPVGLEWQMATYSQRLTFPFLKQGITQTPAGRNFISEAQLIWQGFIDATDLRRQVQRILVDHLIHHQTQYQLTVVEMEQLQALLREAEADPQTAQGQEAAHSAVIFSRERYEPSEGILVGKSPDDQSAN